MVIKINSQEESIECQKYLFKIGYRWKFADKVIKDYHIRYIITYVDLKIFTFTSNEYYCKSNIAIDFQSFINYIRPFINYIRNEKLKRIINDN